MTTAIQDSKKETGAALLERVVIQGDLSKLSPTERISYYRTVCESLGLNPFTRPFDYIVLNGKLTLYAKRDATDQLRRRDSISITITSREQQGDLFLVTARATTVDGRTDEAIGAVSTVGLKSDALANAIMKSETKAKRRVTLSIAGLGWLDETEAASVDGTPVKVDTETGEITEVPSLESSKERADKAAVSLAMNANTMNALARGRHGKPFAELNAAEMAEFADELDGLVLSKKGDEKKT